MKHMKRLIVLTVLCGIIFCACTADNNREGNSLSTGSSIENNTTGSAVAASSATSSTTEAAVKTDTSKKIQTDDIRTLRYANDRNIYAGNGRAGICQYDLNGKKEKQYDIWKELGVKKSDITKTEVLWVDNDELFFSYGRKYKYLEIWCVPLKQTGEKKRLNMSKKEKIDRVKDLDCLITKTSDEIIYCADNKICKMNRKTKRKKELYIGGDEIDPSWIMRDRQGIPFVLDNRIYYNNGSTDEMYQLDLESWETVSVGMDSEWCNYLETDGKNIYYKTYKNFIKYNVKTGEKVELFSDRKLWEEIDKVESQGVIFSNKVSWSYMMESHLIASYYYENRLYLVVQIGEDLDSDEDGDEFDGDDVRVMFSCLASDGSDFRFEKEITQYLWENSIACNYYIVEVGEEEKKTVYWHVGSVWEMTGEFLYFMDGCIVMHFYDEEAEGGLDERHRLVVYDIRDGVSREVRKYSDEYGYFKALGFSENWMIRGADWYITNMEPLIYIQATKKEWEEKYEREQGTYY